MSNASFSRTEGSNEKVLLSVYLKGVSFIALIAVVILVRDILLLTFIAILFASLLSFPVNWLSKKMPRGMAVFLTFLFMFVGLGSIGILAAPQLSDQTQAITKRLPDAVDRIQGWFKKVKTSDPVARLPEGGKIADRLSKRAGGLTETVLKGIFPAAKGVVGLISVFVYVFILSIFFIARPESYRDGIRSLVPQSHEKEFDETCSRLSQGLRHWVGGVLVTMTLMGTFTGIGLAIAGIEDWLLLSLLTFFGTFVPYLGAIASAVPGLLIALSQSPKHFFYASIIYLLVHILEGYIVEPIVMRRAIELKPAMLLLGQSLLFSLVGILGVIVAAPLLACLQIMIQYLYIERSLGKNLETRPSDKNANR